MYLSSGKAYLGFPFPAQFLPFPERRKMGKFEPWPRVWLMTALMSSVLTTLVTNDINTVNRVKADMDGGLSVRLSVRLAEVLPLDHVAITNNTQAQSSLKVGDT